VAGLKNKRVVLWIDPHTLESSDARNVAEVANVLVRWGCRVETVSSRPQLEKLLGTGRIDLVLSRVCASCLEPLELLAEWESRAAPGAAHPPMVLLATAFDVPSYLEGMGRGAFDCVALPVEERELMRVVKQALRARALLQTA
jgi:DNA-binding NtrC family response regulator